MELSRVSLFWPRNCSPTGKRGANMATTTDEESFGFLPWIAVLVTVIAFLLVCLFVGRV